MAAAKITKSQISAFGCVLVAVVFVASLVAYGGIMASGNNSAEGTYQRLFGSTPIVGGNYSFSPPISMYQALTIALKSDGWNTSSLQNMTVYVSLNYDVFYTNVTALYQLAAKENLALKGHPTDFNTTENGFELLHEVTAPVNNYKPQIYNGVSLRYIWTIALQKGSGICIPPWSYYLVDAATGEMVPLGIEI